MTTELKPCPCGHIPEGLRIEGEVKAKFARVCGECCGEWTVEFRNDYYPLDSEQSWDRAAQAWNSAPRAEPRVEREPSEAIYPSESHAVPLADCRCGASVDFVCRDGDWLARCSGCGLTLGEPHGYSSRLDLCRDWNRVVEREPSDELERLRAENERLRKDAKRYRGLRDDFAWTLSASGNDARLTIHVPGVNPSAIGQTECEFNAAIDAAMAFAAEQAA